MSDEIMSQADQARALLLGALQRKTGRDALEELWGGVPDAAELDELSDDTVIAIAAGVRAWVMRYYARLVQLHGGQHFAPASAAYVITEYPDGRKAITCATCGWTSHHAHDVEQKYCGHCHRFLEG